MRTNGIAELVIELVAICNLTGLTEKEIFRPGEPSHLSTWERGWAGFGQFGGICRRG